MRYYLKKKNNYPIFMCSNFTYTDNHQKFINYRDYINFGYDVIYTSNIIGTSFYRNISDIYTSLAREMGWV